MHIPGNPETASLDLNTTTLNPTPASSAANPTPSVTSDLLVLPLQHNTGNPGTTRYLRGICLIRIPQN